MESTSKETSLIYTELLSSLDFI